jgi:hypothetical protein
VSAGLSTHLEDPVSKKRVRRDLHISNIHSRAAIAKTLNTENNSRRQNDDVSIIKTGGLMIGNV